MATFNDTEGVTFNCPVYVATPADPTSPLPTKYFPFEIADVGTGVAVPVSKSVHMPIVTGASGETNTVAIPTFAGQVLILSLRTDGGGDRVVTFASAINGAGNTIATFGTAKQTLKLLGIRSGSTYAWVIESNIGSVALS